MLGEGGVLADEECFWNENMKKGKIPTKPLFLSISDTCLPVSRIELGNTVLADNALVEILRL